MPDLSVLTDKQINTVAKTNFFLWIHNNWKISSGRHKGKPFSIDTGGVPKWYILDILKDNNPHQTIMKCAQSHISEIMVAKSLYIAETENGNLGYFFPAGQQLNDFVGGRVMLAIDDNEYLGKRKTGQYSKGLIQYSGSNLYFRGSKKRQQIISIDCDKFIAVDEVDEVMAVSEVGDVVNTILERGNNGIPEEYAGMDLSELLANGSDLSSYLKVMLISTPTYENMGIHRYFLEGNQQIWHITCDNCGQEQPLDIFINGVVTIDGETFGMSDTFDAEELIMPHNSVHLACWKCSAILDRFKKGRYIPQNPKSFLSSRTVSRLFHPTGNLKKIVRNLNNPLKVKETYNSDLGLPYSPQGGKITERIIRTLISHKFSFQSKSRFPTSAGIDVGKNFTLTIYDKFKLIYADEFSVKDLERLYRIFNNFNVRCAVFDAQPEVALIKKIAETLRGQVTVWRTYYNRNSRQKELYVKNKRSRALEVNRNELMGLVMDLHLDGKIQLPSDIIQWKFYKQFVLQMCKPTRILVEDVQSGNQMIQFPRNKPDDYFHASGYGVLAGLLGGRQIKTYNNNYLAR